MIVFSGSLSSKLKADLLELAQALDISLDAQLDGCPQLKDDLKFTGLYGRLPHEQKCTHASLVDENAALGPAKLLLSILQSIVDSMTCNI
ncbi:hypothetical protein BDR04DRAFT_1096143 [Suillus decipiens]|nr:hypothetical protein BDR04DRAFT_1096143 [Suillus decipiens]